MLTVKIAIVVLRPRLSKELLELSLRHELHDHIDWRCNWFRFENDQQLDKFENLTVFFSTFLWALSAAADEPNHIGVGLQHLHHLQLLQIIMMIMTMTMTTMTM